MLVPVHISPISGAHCFCSGISPSTAKLDLVVGWPVPTSVSELQSFLALVNYFHKSIQGYAVLVKPPTDLLKKDASFLWSSACQNHMTF
jgi:hypothetical protein